MYEESTEYYQYMTIVNAEKIGFDKLIQVKEHLHIELKDYQLEKEAELIDKKNRLENTRHGGIKNLFDNEVQRDVIVIDCREFSCLTPVYLYEKGFQVIPMVLTVGDYVLSDDICIERKSVHTNDLFESFRSGRLLQQITNMCRFYKKPVLLIEFDESIPFKLHDSAQESTLGGDVNPGSIISKITLLTLHFPLL